MSVNKANILRWVEALESGEYQQGVGYLHDHQDNLFCCLGVACDLAYRDGAVTKYTSEDEVSQPSYVTRYGKSELATVLPDEVVEWLGLSCQNPEVDTDDSRVELTHLNDGWGLSFQQIAEYIRREYL